MVAVFKENIDTITGRDISGLAIIMSTFRGNNNLCLLRFLRSKAITLLICRVSGI
ncbi:hypothetical protein WN51_07825 [Melipona quadrifasciata]|uniref:Uncharacterized protein n=1 Tax=Melipona quadrifasciata TaxID=166423 RepID=A0A0N0BJ00_9HYME|nr:hypothetical protein WN51_07825 [Melipona quadrifasciata]